MENMESSTEKMATTDVKNNPDEVPRNIRERDRLNDEKGTKKFKIKWIVMIGIVVIVFVCIIIVILSKLSKENEPEIITTSTIEKIINVSNLSTFEAVYNGVAQVMNEKNIEDVDYYVSYEAKVKAGFDLEKVGVDVADKKKIITVTIPEIEITEVNVDIASLDYIFINDKANTSTVSEQVYKKCIEDVENECSSENAIYELAGQNAKNVIKALVNPFVEQLDEEYKLIINITGVDDNEENS